MSITAGSIAELAARLRESGANLVTVERPAAYSDWAVERTGSVRRHVVEALEAPLEFPPLDRCVVPGDRVAIAVDEAVPRLPEVIAGAIDAFTGAGIDAEAISIVTDDRQSADAIDIGLSSTGHGETRLVVHDSSCDAELCYVGSLQNGQPLLTNRTLFEADVIFPIGCARLGEVLGSVGVFGSLHPRFSDAATVRRWRMAESLDPQHHVQWQSEVEEAGWLIGAPLVMEVVPGPHGEAAHVVAGEPAAVGRFARDRCRDLWSGTVSQPASLVIATVEGGRATQSWENVARAVDAAARIVQEDGALAICCSQLAPPSKSLKRLADADPADVLRQLRHDSETDTWSAWQLALARMRGPVYLLGGLEVEVTEELGLAPVNDYVELARLASRHESCILLEDSHQCVVTALA